jgi:hypothetical protein
LHLAEVQEVVLADGPTELAAATGRLIRIQALDRPPDRLR